MSSWRLPTLVSTPMVHICEYVSCDTTRMPFGSVVVRVSGTVRSFDGTLGGMKEGTALVMGRLDRVSDPNWASCVSRACLRSSGVSWPASSKGSCSGRGEYSFDGARAASPRGSVAAVVAAASAALVVVISGASVRVGYS